MIWALVAGAAASMFALGYAACAVRRLVQRATHPPCSYCNGVGYFANAREAAATHAATLAESQEFRP